MEETRPAQRLHPHLALGAVVVAWFLLSRADDVVLVRSIRFAVVVLILADLLWAVARCRRASVRIVDQPTYAFVGDDIGLDVEVRGAGTGIAVAMTSSPGAPWLLAVGDSVAHLPGTAHFRGVATRVDVSLRAHGPLGLIGYSRAHPLPIRPLWIARRPVEPATPVTLADGLVDDTGVPDLGDAMPAGVREYRPGDPWRRIAWPVTARAGRLVTREYEREAVPVVRLAVDLGPTPTVEGERALGVAAWLGGEALRRGCTLVVRARWSDDPADADVIEEAVDAAGLHRVLAGARYGPCALPPDRRYLVVSRDGVEWR